MTGDGLVSSRRSRRALKIRAAALAYVRECGRQNQVIDLEEFGRRRWPRTGDIKRRNMIDALREDLASGVSVVDVWQRFEIAGSIARRLVGARSFGDLYRILMVNNMPVGFRPGDVAGWARNGKMSATAGREILGIESDEEFEAFVAAWTGEER